MIKLKFSNNPTANTFRFGIVIWIAAVFIFKVDLTKLIFKKTLDEMKGPDITETMTKEQYAEVVGLMTKPNTESKEIPPQIAEENTIAPRPEPEAPHSGDFYKYTDEKGVIVIANQLESVPVRYRSKMKVSAGSIIQTTAVIVKNNQIFVPVSISYQGRTINVHLQLDTGATGVVISPAIAQRLGIRPESTRQGISTIANGSKVATFIASADSITVGPKSKGSIDLNIMPRNGREETGLLGMSFLADFPHTIDMKSQVIKWM